MSVYCNIHDANNCLECAIERQTKRLEAALQRLVEAKAEERRSKRFMTRLRRLLRMKS